MNNNFDEMTICRLCGYNICGESALSLYTSENVETAIVAKIKHLTGNKHEISIDDGLPQKVCSTCAENVEHCYELVTSYVETYHKLRNLIFTDKSEPDYNNDNVSVSVNADPIEEKELNEPIVEEFSTLIRYRCKLCHKSYFAKEDFTIHRCSLDKSAKKICTECSQAFIDNEELKLHIVEKHTEMNDLIGKKAYKCEICMSQFKTPLVYHLHMIDHNICKYCDTILLDPKSLNTHNCIHWRNKKRLEKYECDQCRQKFPQEKMLKVHAKQVHITICDICGQTCRDIKLHKMQHVIKDLNVSETDLIEKKNRKIKSKYRRTCEICRASFKSPLNYKFHIQKHKSKLVSCEICKFKTASFKMYKNHLHRVT